MIISFVVSEESAKNLIRHDREIAQGGFPENTLEGLMRDLGSGHPVTFIRTHAKLIGGENGNFIVRYDKFLPLTPLMFGYTGVKILKVILARKNIKPTQAVPSYYLDTDMDCEADVEEFVLTDRDQSHIERVQSITVTGPDLDTVNQFHSALCLGNANDARAYAF